MTNKKETDKWIRFLETTGSPEPWQVAKLEEYLSGLDFGDLLYFNTCLQSAVYRGNPWFPQRKVGQA